MKHVWLLILGAFGAPVLADPLFEDGRTALPVPHIYSGGWEHFVGGGVAVFDCNDDDVPDIFAAGGEGPSQIYHSTAADPLTYMAAPLLHGVTGITGLYPIDINSDGTLDLVVLRVGPNIVLQGWGQCTFANVTDQWGFETGDHWSTAFSATWEDGQNWPTLAVGNYVNRNDPDGPFEACDANHLYRPDGAGYAPPIGLKPGFCALSMLFSDCARTGTELRISNDRHYYVTGGYEQMWRLDPLRERDATDGWSRLELWGMGIASADLQGDGFPDVMLTSMADQVLMYNDGTGFLAAPYSVGTTAHRPHVGDDGRPSTGWHAEFGDIDNDGLLDLFIAKGNVDQMPGLAMEDPNSLLMQQPDGTFVEASVAAGIATVNRSRGAALADFDGDGQLDLVVINRRAEMELWLNRTDANPSSFVDLRQSGVNTYAIGTWLEIDRDGDIEWRERTIGGGHASGSMLPVHVGWGDAKTVRIRAHWPDGTVSDWAEAEPGTVFYLHNRP